MSFRTFIEIRLRPMISVAINICVSPMYRQKIDISNDVLFMKIVRVVCDYRLERQYLMNIPRTVHWLFAYNLKTYPEISRYIYFTIIFYHNLFIIYISQTIIPNEPYSGDSYCYNEVLNAKCGSTKFSLTKNRLNVSVIDSFSIAVK